MDAAPRIKRYGGPTREAAWASFQHDAAEAGPHGWLPASHRLGPDYLEVTYSHQPTITEPAAVLSPPPAPTQGRVRLPSFDDDPNAYVAAAMASTDPDTIKVAIEQLRLAKLGLAQSKREVTAEIAEIRADYSGRVAQRGSKVRGGGTLGKWGRTYQTAQRDSDRRSVAEAIEPLTERKEGLDRATLAVDEFILDLRQRLVDLK